MPLPLLPTTELDLANLDRVSLLTRLQTLAYQVIPQWSDFSPNFPENLLLEAQAMIGSMMASVLNERCRQAYKATVTDRLAMIRLGQPFGYTLSGATASLVDGTFYLPNGVLATAKITIPIGTRLTSGDAQYQLTEAAIINIGANASSTVTLENAESQTEQFTSDETANMVIQLSMEDIIENSIAVSASDGTYSRLNDSGQELKSLLEVGPDDLAFIPMIDSNGRAYIYFGNSINGKIPIGTITVTYKTGGSEAGRVAASASWTVQDAVYDENNALVTVLFQNPAASTAGYNQTTVEEARIRAPLALRTIERAVNEEDFEYVASLESGIAKAAAITSNYAAVDEDTVYLYVVAYGSPYASSGYYPPTAPTSLQLQNIADSLDVDSGSHPQLMGVLTTVQAAVFLDITVKVRIYKESGYSAATVKANIQESLEKFFAVTDNNRSPNPKVDFGYKLLDANGNPDYKIAWSNVFNAINDTAGVREVSYDTSNLLLNDLHQSIVLAANEFPRLSTVTVYDMDQSGVEI